jgi:predicted ATPase
MKDFKAIYGDKISNIENGDRFMTMVDQIMLKPFKELSESEFSVLDKVTVSAWDIIQANSGGHKCITNISGLSYLGRAPRPNDDPYRFNPEHESAPYIKFVKMLQKEFVTKLKEKIQGSKQTA